MSSWRKKASTPVTLCLSSIARVSSKLFSKSSSLIFLDEEVEEDTLCVEFYLLFPYPTSMLSLLIKWKVSKGILPLLGNRRIIYWNVKVVYHGKKHLSRLYETMKPPSFLCRAKEGGFENLNVSFRI